MRIFRRLFPLLSLACAGAFAADSTFTLTATSADWQRYFPSVLGNGYLSTLTAPRGTEGNLAYLVAYMDYTADDMARPAAIPGWSEIDYSTGDSPAGHFWMNQVALDADMFKDYAQTLDMQQATLTTHYRYVDHGRSTQVEVTSFVSQAAPHLAATRLELTPDFDGTVQLSFALNLWAPHQPRLPLATLSGDQMQEAVAANNLQLVATPPATPDRAPLWYHGDTHVLTDDGDTRDFTLWLDGRAAQGPGMAEAAAIRLPDADVVNATLHKSAYRLALNLEVKVRKGRTYAFDKFVAVSRQDWGGGAKADLALASTARSSGFAALLAAHRLAWRELWKSDIVIDGDPRAQTLVHSDLYYLLSASTPNTRWSIGACGLTPNYAGHIFWDADSWIFPALLLLHPDRAESLVAFRAATLPAALQRAAASGLRGAKYPWESDPGNGTEQTPRFAHVLGEREIHVNADIAIAQWQYWLATGDREWLAREGWPVIRAVADFWVSRATWNASAKRYDILHVTSIAEDHNDVPNDTFTNVSARKVLRIAVQAADRMHAKPDQKWSEVANRLYIPFSASEQRHLDFDPSVPRAPTEDSTLAALMFPSLDLSMPPQVRRNDFERVTSTFHVGDPANGMSMAPMSIAAATAGDAAAAVAWLQNNFSNGMIKPPFNVRTETADNNTGYFLTASAGFVQNLVYGLSGLRIEEAGLVDAYAPVLPAQWRSLTLRGIAFRGERYDVRVEHGADGRPRLTRTTH